MSKVSLNIVEDTIYAEGKIYCLKSHNTDKIYIGSTVLPLCDRLATHVFDFRHKDKFMSSFYILDSGDYYIELIEKYPCNSNEQLRKREQQWLDYYKDIATNEYRAYSSAEDRLEINRLHDKTPARKEAHNAYKRIRVQCPICFKDLSQGYLKTHIDSKH